MPSNLNIECHSLLQATLPHYYSTDRSLDSCQDSVDVNTPFTFPFWDDPETNNEASALNQSSHNIATVWSGRNALTSGSTPLKEASSDITLYTFQSWNDFFDLNDKTSGSVSSNDQSLCLSTFTPLEVGMIAPASESYSASEHHNYREALYSNHRLDPAAMESGLDVVMAQDKLDQTGWGSQYDPDGESVLQPGQTFRQDIPDNSNLNFSAARHIQTKTVNLDTLGTMIDFETDPDYTLVKIPKHGPASTDTVSSNASPLAALPTSDSAFNPSETVAAQRNALPAFSGNDLLTFSSIGKSVIPKLPRQSRYWCTHTMCSRWFPSTRSLRYGQHPSLPRVVVNVVLEHTWLMNIPLRPLSARSVVYLANLKPHSRGM